MTVGARNAIEIAGVTSQVMDRSGMPLQILTEIDLTIQAGEFVALVGPSGCGKSTLLNIISGLIRPSTGSVSISGSLGADLRKPKVGYMFQSDALLPWRTILSNVKCGLKLDKVPNKEAEVLALGMLEQLGLKGFENHYPAELSGGMRQRASLARTWVTNPDVLFMDEPFGALDSQTKLVIRGSFLDFWDKHRKTVVLVTHDLEEAVAMADRVVVMASMPGRIKAQYRIDLPRPRAVVELRSDPKFLEYWRQIWDDLETDAKTVAEVQS